LLVMCFWLGSRSLQKVWHDQLNKVVNYRRLLGVLGSIARSDSACQFSRFPHPEKFKDFLHAVYTTYSVPGVLLPLLAFECTLHRFYACITNAAGFSIK